MDDRAFWMFVWGVVFLMFSILVGGAFANNSYTDYKVGELIKAWHEPQKIRCAFIVSAKNHPECILMASQTNKKQVDE